MNHWEHVRGPLGSRQLVDLGCERGADERGLLVGTGLTLAQLRDDLTQVTAGQEVLIAENLVRELGDVTGLGLQVGSATTIGHLGVWAFAMLSSPTYRAALAVGLRYLQLTSALMVPQLRDTLSETVILLHDEHLPSTVREFLAERDLASAAALLSALRDPELSGLTLETRFAGARAEVLRSLYAPVAVHPGCDAHRIRGSRELLERALPLADETTRSLCERECERLLEAHRRRTAFAAIVRARLTRAPGDMPSLQSVAAELHMSPRSLRRHLAAEGTSYRALREEVTTTLAVELLDTVGLSVGEVAQRLGYSDATSFAHAFSRWTGTPPGQVSARERPRS